MPGNNPAPSLELIIERLGTLSVKLDEGTERLQANIITLGKALKEKLDDHEVRLRVLERDTQSLSSRLTIWSSIQAGYTTLVSAIAGYLGMRQP